MFKILSILLSLAVSACTMWGKADDGSTERPIHPTPYFCGTGPVDPLCDVDDDSGIVDQDAGTYFFTDAEFLETCGSGERQWDGSDYYAQTTPAGWEPSCFFNLVDTRKGRFVSSQNDPFEITMESDSADDFNRLRPDEVAELAYWMTAVHALMDLPCSSAGRRPYDILSKGHFVVVGDNNVFNDVYSGDDDPNRVGAYINRNRFNVCYESPDDVYWTSVIRSKLWTRQNVGVVVHEMTHMMSIIVNGHSDSDHEDPRLWRQAGGDESMMSIVIAIHDCQYFPLTCPDASNPEL